MEPGDLRINSRLRDDSGVPKHSPGNTYTAANEGNSVLHFRSHVRPAVITDGRMHHHMPSHAHMPGPPLMIDRNEPVKVWRDPSLMNSGEIRHVVSMQHSGVVHLGHPMVAHSVGTSANLYQQHHDNKPIDTTSRLIPHSTADSLRGRAPVVYAHPHAQNNAKSPPDNWRPGPGVLQNSKDFRVSLTGKSTVEQAVHDHFVESLRLAQLKGNTSQSPVVKPEERQNSHNSVSMQQQQQQQQRYYSSPHEKRHHELPNPQVIYQIHQQHQALGKPELPTPPPLRSEPQYRTGNTPENSRKHQIYGPPEVITRTHHDTVQQQHQQQQQQQQQSSIRYEPESISRIDVLPSDNCVRYQKLPPAPRRPTSQTDLQLERNRSPFGKHVPPSASPNSYHSFPQAHMNKHKVSSPAPPHIYGKPGPSTRPYDINNDPSVPLPLTSKGGLTRPSQSSPTSYPHPSTHGSPTLPQHDVRKSDVAYYMYNNGPPATHTFQPSLSPQAHLHSIQTQPLDLGGKRKMEDDPVPAYKGPISEYADQASIKPIYGSRKPLEDPRPKLAHSYINTPVPLSLTVSEVPSKRKNEDMSLPLHLADSKKIRSEGSITGGTSSLTIVRKEQHDIKPAISEYVPVDTHTSRPYIDNPAPISLTVSGSDIKPKPEMITSTPPPPAFEVRSVIAKTGATTATPPPQPLPPIITTPIAATSPLCNGKHRDTVNNMEILNSSVKSEPKPEIDTTIVKVEAVAASTTVSSTITSSSSSSSSSTASSSTPSKFQKVPKKAWVLQWHEGDNAKSSDDNSSNKGTGDASDANSHAGTSTALSTVSSQDKAVTEENSDKLPNGHIPASSGGSDAKPSTTAVNGFTKERLNESDVCSENESDNSGKDKASIDSGLPTKKTGRKGKCGQTSQKPDLRKDGLCKRPPVSQLKKTGESFIQAETCNRVTPKIGKCRECRWHPAGRGSKKQSGAYCRFYGFRKLRYTKGGSLTVAGFSDPFSDPAKITEHDQFRLWLPSNVAPEGLDVTMSKFLLSQLCDQFCDLVRQEEEAREVARTQELSTVAWKPLLKGVLEMCDVCDTTLFNFHWACGKCGFVVCLSCFKARQNDTENGKVPENAGKDRDEFQWLLCSNRCTHELDKLMLVQTIAGDALTELNKKVHNVCDSWKISQNCKCKLSCSAPEPDSAASSDKQESSEGNNNDSKNSKCANGASSDTKDSKGELLGTPTTPGSPSSNDADAKSKNSASNGCSNNDESTLVELRHFKRLSSSEAKIKRKSAFLKALSTVEAAELCPNVKHSWLCNGKLLRLLEPLNPKNASIFHEVWKRGQPVLVSEVAVDKDLWTSESFSKDFGDYKNDLVNSLTGEVLPNQQMRKFWEGFACVNKRIRDDDGEPLLLKLKDWPPTDDFAQTLPSRFQDLMAALPLPEYTRREGKLNLASRLPSEFMKPDLGPKMYIAYGSGTPLDMATTNLHLDVSDVVNVLVHCESPQDVDKGEHEKAVIKALEESDCDLATMNRVLQNKEVPGALWHVYDAKDADKIRDLLNKVATEKGNKVESHHDAIHDQSWYLDKSLRTRLVTEYNVSGYSILQCAGDAVFVPAGAPHQVRNLQNCIKVAEEFVSPENISHSLYLTEEEHRTPSKTQTNHEDRLQIKNVVYHAVKDALTVLLLQNNEKSDVHQNTSNDSSVASTTALSKDCQFQPSTSPKEPTPVVVNAATN